VRLDVALTEDQAEQLAQFLKRVGFSDVGRPGSLCKEAF
jgi:hypothetical protein